MSVFSGDRSRIRKRALPALGALILVALMGFVFLLHRRFSESQNTALREIEKNQDDLLAWIGLKTELLDRMKRDGDFLQLSNELRRLNSMPYESLSHSQEYRMARIEMTLMDDPPDGFGLGLKGADAVKEGRWSSALDAKIRQGQVNLNSKLKEEAQRLAKLDLGEERLIEMHVEVESTWRYFFRYLIKHRNVKAEAESIRLDEPVTSN